MQETVATVPILDLLPEHLRNYYSKGKCLKLPDKDALRPTKAWIMVKKVHYKIPLDNLVYIGLLEYVDERPTEINGLFGVPKDGEIYNV